VQDGDDDGAEGWDVMRWVGRCCGKKGEESNDPLYTKMNSSNI